MVDIYVSTTEDIVDATDDFISLREAIIQANATSGSTIYLDAGLTYNLMHDKVSPAKSIIRGGAPNGGYSPVPDEIFQLSIRTDLFAATSSIENDSMTGDLDITGNVTIQGNGATIANQMNVRALQVHNGANLLIEDLTLDGTGDTRNELDGLGAQKGGALLNSGGLITINRTTFTDHDQRPNEAAKYLKNTFLEIFPDSQDAGLKYDSFQYTTGAGGAIYNDSGAVKIKESKFTDNVAGFGGAIAAGSGAVSVDSSIFDGNQFYSNMRLENHQSKFPESVGIHGGGAAIFSHGGARVEVHNTDVELKTDFVNNGNSTGVVADEYRKFGFSKNHLNQHTLIESTGQKIYVDPTIDNHYLGLVIEGNSSGALIHTTGISPAIARNGSTGETESNDTLIVRASKGESALLTLTQGIDLSLDNPDLFLVVNSILSQSEGEIVIQLAGNRIVLTGSGLSFTGDPVEYLNTPADLIAAATGTITGITIQTKDGTANVGTLTGISSSFKEVITDLTTANADGSRPVLADVFNLADGPLVDPSAIQGVYVALFGRPADPAGLNFFNSETGDGADLTKIGDLASTAEYKARFDDKSSTEIITTIYQSLFGRDPEQAGLDFFVKALADGTLNINNITIGILDGALGTDKTLVDKKIAAADLFTAAIDTPDELAAYQGTVAAQSGINFLSAIIATSTANTAETAQAAVAALSAAATVTARATFAFTEVMVEGKTIGIDFEYDSSRAAIDNQLISVIGVVDDSSLFG